MKRGYNAPQLICEEFDFESVIAESTGNISQVKNGNAGNNQECWKPDRFSGDTYMEGNQYYACT